MTTATPQIPSPIPSRSSSSNGSRLSNRSEDLPAARSSQETASAEYGGNSPSSSYASQHNPQLTPPRSPHTRQTTDTGLRSRANLKVATLNMKGRASTLLGWSSTSKWAEIQYTMKHNTIAILALQETHLDQPHINEINTLYSKRLRVFSTADPTRPATSSSVAFVLNKSLLNTSLCTTAVLIPGRALFLSLKWHNHESLHFLNVYAPVETPQQPDFWNCLVEKWAALHLPKPDFLLGDFNLTEDALDRAPVCIDPVVATDSLRNAHIRLGVQDYWRHTFPDTRLFTYTSPFHQHFSQSRLDRIYTSDRVSPTVYEWNCLNSSVPTDHHLITVRYALPNSPQTGSGRWTLPLYLLNNTDLLSIINKKGLHYMAQMDRAINDRTPLNNPQTLWSALKNDIIAAAKPLSRAAAGKINSRINCLNNDRTTLLSDPNYAENQDLRYQVALLANEIQHLQQKQRLSQRQNVKMKWALTVERNTRPWTRSTIQPKP
ncbi:DNase I-like protein, partial [Dentipellis sp. KUC8613]